MAHEFSSVLTTIAKRPFSWTGLLVSLAWLPGCTSNVTPPAEPPPVQEEPVAASPAAVEVEPPIMSAVPFRLGKLVEIRSVQSTLEFPKKLSSAELNSRALPRNPQPGLWAMLDQHPVRSFANRRLKLSDLLNEDEELAPGWHWLSLFQEAGSEEKPVVEFSLQAFAVESEPEGMPLAPGCALLWPVGTYNGPEAAENIQVLAVPRQADVSAVRYEARSEDWFSEGTFAPGQIVILDSPPNGDIEISATCFVQEESLSLATQVITINGDAPSGASP